MWNRLLSSSPLPIVNSYVCLSPAFRSKASIVAMEELAEIFSSNVVEESKIFVGAIGSKPVITLPRKISSLPRLSISSVSPEVLPTI